jgi:hypothetical protein
VVPANVSGEWVLNNFDSQSGAILNLSQKFQYVGGSITLGGKNQPILNAELKGDRLEFSYIDIMNNLRTIRLTFNESKVRGDEKSAYMNREFFGFRR